jgi:hypothetical protein
LKIVVAGPTGTDGGLQTHFRELKFFLRSASHEVLDINVDLSSLTKSIDESCWQVLRSSGAMGRALRWGDISVRGRVSAPDLLIAVANGFGYALLGAMQRDSCFRIRTEVTDSFRKHDSLHETMARAYDATAVQSPRLLAAQQNKISTKRGLGVLPCFSAISESGDVLCSPVMSGADKLRLAFFGRMAANKGLVPLMAAAKAATQIYDLSIDIWGQGPMQPSIARLIEELDLSSVVSLRGKYPYGDSYRDLLGQYHGLVLPSQFSEGLPLVLLEAASVGLPFLSCDVGAIADSAIGNPDASIIPAGEPSLRKGLLSWCERLRCREFSPARLQRWFRLNHSREVHAHRWMEMLANPRTFFTDNLARHRYP